MKYVHIFIAMLSSSLGFSQNPIVPYSPLGFKNYQTIWSRITEDSSISDNIKYDGRHHFNAWHNKLLSVESQGFVYTTDVSGLYGIEGGIVRKIDASTGDIIWSNVFDLRSQSYHEYPQYMYFSNEATINLISYRTLEVFPNTELLFKLKHPLVIWSLRKYDVNSGNLIEHKFNSDQEFSFYSNENTNFFFENESGYVYLKRSMTETNEYYSIHSFDKNFGFINSDTIDLNLPTEKNDILVGGILPYDEGYISLDVKTGTTIPRYYSLLFWDKNFNIKDSIPSSQLTAIFSDIPSRYYLRFVNNDFIIIETSKFNGNEFVPIGYLLNHQGELVMKFNYPGKNGYNQRSSYLFFDEKSQCPYFITRQANNGYFLELYNVCDSLNKRMLIQTNPDNIAITPVNVSILENKNVIISCVQTKDTTFNNQRRLFHHGVVWMVIDGSEIGITTTVKNISVNKNLPFPNPFYDQLHLEYPESAYLRIVDLTGKVMTTKQILPGKTSFDTSNWTPGMYIVHVQNKVGSASSFKVIKQ